MTPEDEEFEAIAKRQASYTGNGTAGRENMTAPTGFLFQMPKAEKQEPVANDWSVFNTVAEVWGRLSLADAVAELTPERLKRGWSAVCVINEENPPIYTTPQREWVGLTDEEIDELHGSPMELEHSCALKWVRVIEAKLKEKNT
jgi:hypothetical protein